MGQIAFAGQPSYTPAELYGLLARQVQSYHAHRRMGENTSVPVELARELLESVGYTLEIAGEGGGIDGAVRRGQAILAQRREQAAQLHRLLLASGDWGNHWWQALEELGRYLDRYDHRHLAHRVPEILLYPPAVPVPEGLRGMDWTWAYLNTLWAEVQILYGFSDQAIQELHGALPPDYWEAPENICEQPLWNALGRKLLGLPLDSLLLSGEQRQAAAAGFSPEGFAGAKEAVCRELGLPEHPAACAGAVMDRALPRLLAALPSGDLSRIFL